LSAEKDLKLNHQFADMSIIFGTVINKNAATMSAMVTTITTCWMMHIPISFTDILVLIVPLWILGLQTPGIPGGAAFFMSPVIAVILKVPNPELYVTTFVTMYSGLIPMFASGTNTIVNGLIGAILQDRLVATKKFESTQKGEVA
jgi:Na+/H+-dicarboxylate symporter